ncbi:MAG TPA: transglutaminaseTgpA domain-containing protein [Methylomirabilota bacterium]
MSAERALRLVAYLVVALGAMALWVAELLGTGGLAVVALALGGGGWLVERTRPGLALDRMLALSVAGFAILDVGYLAERMFDGLVRLLVLLVVLRLLTARKPHQFRDAGLLAFFMLVAAAAVAFGVGFLFVFVAFFMAATVLLVLAHELSEAERAGGQAAMSTLTAGRGLFTLGLGAAGASLVVTFALFFVIPRIGEATLALRTPVRRMLTGFSDRVELGTIGELEQDTSVAMRVRLPDTPLTLELVAQLRWRGVALDHFDGRVWTATRRRRVPFGGGRIVMEKTDAPAEGRLVKQEIFLEPIGTETLFATPRVLRVNLGSAFVGIDEMDSISVPTPATRLTYTAESVIGGRAPERQRLTPNAAARYLQLPPLAARIPGLAREVTAGTEGPAAAGVALVNFLRRQFAYTLTLERRTELPPLEEFLFVSRRGNCEYFASALAVMLRSLGTPARVVTGFQRGEWNPYGEYFLVRMADAHAWVEAYVDGTGWVTLDPSPRDPGADVGWSAPTLYFDALRLTWHRYIVSWSSHDQFRAAATVRRAAVAWRPGRTQWSPWPEAGWALPAVTVAAGALAWLVWRWVVAGAPQRPAPVPDFYRRALRTVARRGLRLEPGETAREFALRVSQALPARAGAFTRVTAAYEAVRFGGAALDGAERASIDGCLRQLTRRQPPEKMAVSG